jgi:hypothetical protein
VNIKYLLLIILNVSVISSQSTGLEVLPGTGMYFLVETMPNDAIKIGLTQELIEIKVEKFLRKNRIKFINPNYATPNYLYINLNVVGNSFSIKIEFNRWVDYKVGEEIFSKYAPTYSVNGTGTHTGDKTYIINGLYEYLDIFIFEYNRSNSDSIQKVFVPRTPVINDDISYTGIGGGHWISKKSVNGNMITLEDKSLWEVHSIDRIYTMLWLPISNITVLESNSPFGKFRYELYNTDDGEKALAKYLGSQD